MIISGNYWPSVNLKHITLSHYSGNQYLADFHPISKHEPFYFV